MNKIKYKSFIEASSQIHRWEVVRQRNTMKQRETARTKTTPSTQEKLIARETFQYVTTNPRRYGVVSTRNERRPSTIHGLDWTGQLDCTIGLDSWTRQLDWTIGLYFEWDFFHFK